MSGHTPGPWFVGTQNDALFIINRPPRPSHDDMADIRDVQVIAKLNDCKGDDDARLMSAAPDLLAALKAISSFWVYGLGKPKGAQPTSDDLAEAERLGELAGAAIAKATGRAS